MSERIRWKRTSLCLEAVRSINMGNWEAMELTLHNTAEDDALTGGWWWKITVTRFAQEYWTAESPDTFQHEDEAANAAYRHAFKYYRATGGK